MIIVNGNQSIKQTNRKYKLNIQKLIKNQTEMNWKYKREINL